MKKGLVVAPVFLFISWILWGVEGAWSSALALGIVLANFALAAVLIAWSAPISLALMMGVALFGYLVRLGVICLVIWMVHDATWISVPALGTTIIISHLGLLFWEMRYIAASLAFPGLRPNRQESPPTSATGTH